MAVAGRVLMIPAGTWTSGKNYAMLDVVIYAGSSYVAKKQINNSTVAPPNATSDWQLLAQGYDVTNVVTKSMIANNFLATDPNTVLSGPMGKSLKDQFDILNSNLTSLRTDVETNNTALVETKAVAQHADDTAAYALYRLGEGRVSMGWNAETLSLNFYVDGVFIGRFIKP